ncbi:hypothetical protein H5410_015524, partial [Solanum commersonii]
MMFINLEKVHDKVLRKVLCRCSETRERQLQVSWVYNLREWDIDMISHIMLVQREWTRALPLMSYVIKRYSRNSNVNLIEWRLDQHCCIGQISDKIRNEVIRDKVEVASIVNKMRE